MKSYNRKSATGTGMDKRTLVCDTRNTEKSVFIQTRSRSTLKRPFQDSGNDDQTDTISESKPTMAMWPVGDPRYCQGPKLRRFIGYSMKMVRTLGTAHVKSKDALKGYHYLLASCVDVYKGEGRVGCALFTRTTVKEEGWICDYTGVRVCGFEKERLLASIKYHGRDDKVLVHVPSEGAIIDPRRCGNVARCVNHSFKPNEKLQEVDISKDKTVVMLQALDYIAPGSEVNIFYGWKTGETLWPIECKCGHPDCTGFI